MKNIHISYVDIDSTTIFDFRGCLVSNLEELEKAIIKEVQGSLSLDGRPLTQSDIKIYYDVLYESPDRISCDAVAIVFYKTMNREPRYLKTL